MNKAQEKVDELNQFTAKWTLDYAVEVFEIYFKDKQWLWSKLLDNAFSKESHVSTLIAMNDEEIL